MSWTIDIEIEIGKLHTHDWNIIEQSDCGKYDVIEE